MTTIRTELTKHYWNNEGAFDKEFRELTEQLMPASGSASSLRGEVIRAANRLYYEYCNNGNCNAREFVNETDGMNDFEEVMLSPLYEKFVNLLSYVLCDEEDKTLTDKFRSESGKIIDSIAEFITSDCSTGSEYFTDNKMHRYDLLIDFVTQWALTHQDDNRELPPWYKKD